MNNKIEKIRSQYVEKESTDFDKLKKLDKKVKSPAKLVSSVIGTIGACYGLRNEYCSVKF